jgi:hypothetical protein
MLPSSYSILAPTSCGAESDCRLLVGSPVGRRDGAGRRVDVGSGGKRHGRPPRREQITQVSFSPDNVHETGVSFRWRSGSPSWPPRRSRSSELEERPGHGPDRGFCALHLPGHVGSWIVPSRSLHQARATAVRPGILAAPSTYSLSGRARAHAAACLQHNA